jgi:hypothetical protein
VADSTAAINAAIADAAGSSQPTGKDGPGGIVYLPAGTYKVGKDSTGAPLSLTLLPNVRIIGEAAQNNSGVVLKPTHGSTGSSHVPVFKYESGSTYITGWSIENIAIDFTNCTSGGAPSSANSGDIGISISGCYLYDINNLSVFHAYQAYKAFETSGKTCFMGTVRKLYAKQCRNGIYHDKGTTMTFENCWVNADTGSTPNSSYWELGWHLGTIYGVTLTSCVLEKWKSGSGTPTGFFAEHCRGLVINGMDVEQNDTNGGRLFYFGDCEVALNAFRTSNNTIDCPSNGTSRLVVAHECAMSLTGSAMGGSPSTGAPDVATNGGGSAEAITLELTRGGNTSAVSIQGCRIGAPDSSGFAGTLTAFKDATNTGLDSLAVLGTNGIVNQLRFLGQYVDVNYLTDAERGVRVFAANERARLYATGNNTNHAGRAQLIDGGVIGAGLRIGTAGSPNYALELTSDSAAKPSTSTWTVASDARTKDNLRPFTHGLDVIRQLLLHTWEYNGLGDTPPGATASGVVAQELQTVLPGAVVTTRLKHHVSDTDQADYLGVNYHLLLLSALQAIKELDARLTTLESQV